MMANVVSVAIAQFLLPDFIGHVAERTGQVLTFHKMPLLAAQLIIAVLGEEIAWRAFFQQRLSERVPMHLSMVCTSILFSLGHFSSGSILIVTYDLVFVFINSLLYGMVFKRTNNVYISALSHLIANGAGIALMLFVR